MIDPESIGELLEGEPPREWRSEMDATCNVCGHGKSIHEHQRKMGYRTWTWACVLEHCACVYRGKFQERVEHIR